MRAGRRAANSNSTLPPKRNSRATTDCEHVSPEKVLGVGDPGFTYDPKKHYWFLPGQLLRRHGWKFKKIDAACDDLGVDAEEIMRERDESWALREAEHQAAGTPMSPIPVMKGFPDEPGKPDELTPYYPIIGEMPILP